MWTTTEAYPDQVYDSYTDEQIEKKGIKIEDIEKIEKKGEEIEQLKQRIKQLDQKIEQLKEIK